MSWSQRMQRPLSLQILLLLLFSQSFCPEIVPFVDGFQPFLLQRHQPKHHSQSLILRSEPLDDDAIESLAQVDTDNNNNAVQDLSSTGTVELGDFERVTALFCGGLAFDAYVEPPKNSSRWERGSRGLNVAFVSQVFTRQLYRGLVEITVKKCEGLPEDEDTAERLISGSGADACILVAAVEGAWKQDIRRLEKEQYHEGVLDLTGAAHVGRSSTAWASVDEVKSRQSLKSRGKATPYHVPATWGRGGQAIWPDEDPFYIYVQDPRTARLVFTILDNDKLGSGKPIGSTYRTLKQIIPAAGLSEEQLMTKLKQDYVNHMKANNGAADHAPPLDTSQTWEGPLKMTSKPRKRDKNGQILAATAAGAAVAGPVGAAAGALIGNFYEGQVQGAVTLQMRYLPMIASLTPQAQQRKVYKVLGGMPGIDWGSMLGKYYQRDGSASSHEFEKKVVASTEDLEHCFFVNHDKTGATCSVYRSLKEKLVIVSFRGTCAPIDLVTDASIVQESWVAGEKNDKDPNSIPRVHTGFRGSLDSISRRLKELILATPGPGETLDEYDMVVTGHSLGGALATLFAADIGEFGIDAGRGLPQSNPSEAWWKAVADTFMGQNAAGQAATAPPRPKSLRVYTFGSPRVGNDALSKLFATLVEDGRITQAYRVVNGEDVVARMPRSVNALVTQVGYEHCGSTVLISPPMTNATVVAPRVWVEGESDNNQCPVRDGQALISPMAEGSLLSDLMETTKELVDRQNDDESDGGGGGFSWGKLTAAASKVTKRVQSISATDLGSVLGLNRDFTEREVKMVQALLQGKALAHHMEDEYYAAMARAVGLRARVGEEIEVDA